MWQNSHLSDQRILMDLEGELSARDARRVRSHLDGCWNCRTRRQELENAIEDFVRVHQRESDAQLPPIAGPRALLKAELAHLSAESRPRWGGLGMFRQEWVFAAAACGLLAIGVLVVRTMEHMQRSGPQPVIVSVPDSRLTPGAALLVSRRAVCSQASNNNKDVPLALKRKVFEEYGIREAEPRAYEVDYLVTPALGGADDIHNLWPHSYSAAVWNAQVKDALEDRLRQMVCDGSLDLREAQQEIATDWIAAYKRYFHTDKPLAEYDKRRAQ